VLLLEAADEFGGGLRSGPLTGLGGFTHDMCATVLRVARRQRASATSTWTLGGRFPAVQAAHPLDGQNASLSTGTSEETANGLGSSRDALAWRESVGRGGGE